MLPFTKYLEIYRNGRKRKKEEEEIEEKEQTDRQNETGRD